MKRLSGFIASLALGLAGILLIGSPAQAHDEVVSTSPMAGETVSAGPIDVAVQFGEDIMQLGENDGIDIVLTGPHQTGVNPASCLRVEAATMSQGYDLDSAGSYSVAWRSVSADGHANSGTFDFNVENNDGYVATGTATCAPVGAVLGAPAPSPSTTDSSGDGQSWQAAIIGIIVAAIIVVAGVTLVRRRKTSGKD
jgi:methionine-rich copper-binding protein CopC